MNIWEVFANDFILHQQTRRRKTQGIRIKCGYKIERNIPHYGIEIFRNEERFLIPFRSAFFYIARVEQ